MTRTLTLTGPIPVPADERPEHVPQHSIGALALDVIGAKARVVGRLYVSTASTEGRRYHPEDPRQPAYRITGTVTPYRDAAAIIADVSSYSVRVYDPADPADRGRDGWSPLRVEHATIGRPDRPYSTTVPDGTREAMYDLARQIADMLNAPSGAMWEALARFATLQATEDKRRLLTAEAERRRAAFEEACADLAAFEASVA